MVTEYSSISDGSTDSATLCGGEGSTCPAVECSCTLATCYHKGARYSHADVDVDLDAVECSSADGKILCLVARNVSEMSSADCITVDVSSLCSVVVSVVCGAVTCGDADVRWSRFVVGFVTEVDHDIEYSDSWTNTVAADGSDGVSVYTVCYGLNYIEATAICDVVKVVCP